MSIEFRDLKEQYRILKKQTDEAVMQVMAEGCFISGARVEALERRLADYVGVKHCISCANGTDALELAEAAYGIGRGDAVFVPDFTFFSTAETVAALGAEPVFTDVCESTFNIDCAVLEEAIIRVNAEGRLRARAVAAVDLFGLPADYREIEKLCKKYGLLLIEDGAQGFGGKIGEKRACSFGDIATTSFFPAKPLGCYGDGGAIFTDDDLVDALLRSLRVHGKSPEDKYDNLRLGRNSRLDTVQAAILDVKLTAFEEYELERVNLAAKMYDERLSHIFNTPEIPEGFYSSRAQYTLRLEDVAQRSRIQSALKNAGIPSMVYYPKPMHAQTAFEHIPYTGQCPVTERLCKTVMSLPMHPYLTERDIDTVCRTILSVGNRK